jgi:hypothetical protein
MKKKKKPHGCGLVKERLELTTCIFALLKEGVLLLTALVGLVIALQTLINMACNYLRRTMWFDVRTKMANQI